MVWHFSSQFNGKLDKNIPQNVPDSNFHTKQNQESPGSWPNLNYKF